MRKQIIAILVAGLVSSHAYAVPQKIYTVQDSPVVNNYIHVALAVPYFFTFPKSQELAMNTLDAFSYEYVYDSDKYEPKSNLGLRTVFVDKNLSRKEVSKELAKILLPGDVVLSYRKEWSGKGPYPHIQLGVSHASLVVIDDEGYALNFDLPLNEDYVQDKFNKGVSYFSSDHFLETELWHVLRPRLTQTQREHVNAWAKLLLKGARANFVKPGNQIYPGQIGFNQDYLSPQIKGKQPSQYLDGTFNLARIALGYGNSIRNNQMFCSEAVWALLSLRNCDPVADATAFRANTRPTCLADRNAEIFPPVPLLGNILTEPNNPKARPGMADGPLMLLQAYQPADIMASIETIFSEHNQQGRMSSGHNAVSNALPPELFAALKQYYQAVFVSPTQAVMAREQISAQAASMGLSENYGPSTFVINALLPEGHQEKALDYAFTVAYVDSNLLKLAKETIDKKLSYEDKKALAIRRKAMILDEDYSPQVRAALAGFDNLPTPMRKKEFCEQNPKVEYCQYEETLKKNHIAIPYAD